MVILKSNQTVFSLETGPFWLPLFHTESLPVTSLSAGASSVGFHLYQAFFSLSLLAAPSEEPSSEALWSSYIVISTQST